MACDEGKKREGEGESRLMLPLNLTPREAAGVLAGGVKGKGKVARVNERPGETDKVIKQAQQSVGG